MSGVRVGSYAAHERHTSLVFKRAWSPLVTDVTESVGSLRDVLGEQPAGRFLRSQVEVCEPLLEKTKRAASGIPAAEQELQVDDGPVELLSIGVELDSPLRSAKSAL